MLHRSSPEGLICITQPNHAWVAGQLAQAWGNEAFGQVAPRQEVCLGAQQHDIGWLKWEQQPTLNPQTGYPRKFSELPIQVHVDIWSGAKQQTLPFGRYAALLISLHGSGLYERYRGWQNSVESTHIVKNFLECEYAFQEQLVASLEHDPYYAPYLTPEVLDRNRRLVAVWDALSLLVCQGFTGEQEVSRVPTADGETTLKLTYVDDNPHHIKVSPWPFGSSQVSVVYEGRILRQPFTDEIAMRDALRANCWITLNATLQPE
jgi:hypothetical protein